MESDMPKPYQWSSKGDGPTGIKGARLSFVIRATYHIPKI